MFVQDLKDSEKAAIDLHGLTVEQAELALLDALDALPRGVRAMEVTHGYSHGTALKRMLRGGFYHPRLRDTQVGLNPGATWLLLK